MQEKEIQRGSLLKYFQSKIKREQVRPAKHPGKKKKSPVIYGAYSDRYELTKKQKAARKKKNKLASVCRKRNRKR